MWILALRQATPHSPQPDRKDLPQGNDPPPPPSSTDSGGDRPKYTQRQETVDVAAAIASEQADTTNGHDVEEVKSGSQCYAGIDQCSIFV